MHIPLILLKHVAKACLNVFTGGIAGELVFGVANDVMRNWEKESDELARRAELAALAQATAEEVNEAVAEAVRVVAADRSEQERRDLSSYLMQVPASIRRTLRRPTDPTGRTVPQALAIKSAQDLVLLLPSRLPRFNPGDSPLVGVDRELVELLGIGGFGEVWKAINPNRPSMPPVALKFCLDPAAKDRLLRHEARLLDRIMQIGVHSGIVALRDTYLKADPPCLEYEYVGGGELTGVIRENKTRGGISPREAARAIACLAKTVGIFHRVIPPIVHRDLKPANILLSSDAPGEMGLKIADFGIGGLAVGQDLERAQTHLPRGELLCSIAHGSYTPFYASPEQIREHHLIPATTSTPWE
ncbi:protein kinase [Singulisphaera sp. Ch08]|uniref:Protein kinase n=1 Tax=Singulisphaera sp. Ch08 TaxID=3120278 RepID=A0AAU7CK64_9BACT